MSLTQSGASCSWCNIHFLTFYLYFRFQKMYLSAIVNYVLPMHSSKNLKTRTASFLLSECNFLQPFALHPSRPRRLPQSSTVISCYIHWKHDELIHAIRYVNKASRPSQTLQIKKICLTPFTVNIIFSARFVSKRLAGRRLVWQCTHQTNGMH